MGWLSCESTFDSNIKGKFKGKGRLFDQSNENNDSSSLLTKTGNVIKSITNTVTEDNLDEPLFNERVADLYIDNINPTVNIPTPPAPPLPPSTSNIEYEEAKNPFLSSINNFAKNKLKRTITVTKKEFDKKGNIINCITEENNNDDNPMNIISDIIDTNDNSLTHNLSQQLDKMKFNEDIQNEVKEAPSWDKPQLDSSSTTENLNKQSNNNENIKNEQSTSSHNESNEMSEYLTKDIWYLNYMKNIGLEWDKNNKVWVSIRK